MKLTATKTISAVAIASVAVLGAQYAGAVGKGAAPQIAPVRNIAHVYTVTTGGGTGEVDYTITSPTPGVYAASFTANFFPAGSPAAPETFSCYLLKNGDMRAQSTVTSTYTSGFYVGADGGNTIKVNAGDVLTAGCGTADGSTWTWGTQPLQVSFVREDGLALGGLSKASQKVLSPVVVAGR